MLYEDVTSDHLALGRAIAETVGALAERAGVAEAMVSVEEADRRRDHVDVRWVTTESAPESSRFVEGEGRIWLETRVPVQADGAHLGHLVLRESLDPQSAYVRGSVWRVAAVAILTLLVCAGIVHVAGHLLLDRPLAPILEKIRRIGAGELEPPLSSRRSDELGVVARELDEMCRRLGELQETAAREADARVAAVDQLRHADRLSTLGKLAAPIDVDLAEHALRRAVELRRLKGELSRLREAEVRPRFGALIGDSPAMRRLLDTIDRVAGSDATVLITGESGVGKELVARALHDHGARARGPFVGVNVAALPESLLESELFGHAKGAFTDARAARAGLFLPADGGTLFLDEVGEMPPSMQAKVLRALQERRVRPVGAEREVAFDARVVAATNEDLLQAVEGGAFREDLYSRLAVIELEVPPLRSRGSDVLAIAHHVLADAARRAGKPIEVFEPEAARRLVRYRWPGNVRELVNCIERAVAMARFDRITVEDLPPRIAEAVGGRRGRAAKILGLDRKTLYRRLERWGVGHGVDEG